MTDSTYKQTCEVANVLQVMYQNEVASYYGNKKEFFELIESATNSTNDFTKKIAKSILDYKKASDKQLFCVARGIVEAGGYLNDDRNIVTPYAYD